MTSIASANTNPDPWFALGSTGAIQASAQQTASKPHTTGAYGVCLQHVIGHYQRSYSKNWDLAQNTFLNNFVHRKLSFAQIFGHPEVALTGSIGNETNLIAQRFVEQSGHSGTKVCNVYLDLLKSGQLCQDLGHKTTQPRQLRAYLLGKLQSMPVTNESFSDITACAATMQEIWNTSRR